MRLTESVIEARARIRVLFPVAMLIYPLWGFVMTGLHPASYDPISQRLLIAAVLGISWWFAETQAKKSRHVQLIFHVSMWLLSLHYMFLVHSNQLAWHYVAGVFLTVTAVFSTLRGFLPALLYSIAISVSSSWIVFSYGFNNESSRFLFLGVLTNLIVLMALQFQRESVFESKLVSESRYRTLLSNLIEGVILQDSNGEIQTFNSSACQILGVSADELMGMKLSDPRWQAIDQDNSLILQNQHPAMLALGSLESQEERVIGVLVGNERKWLRLNSQPLVQDDEAKLQGSVISFFDVTQEMESQKRIREQQALLAQASKLSSLGEMAAGIAHEVNNPLSIIEGRTRQLRRLIEAGDFEPVKLLDLTDKIHQTVFRISKIVTGLKAFSREGSTDPFETIRLGQLVEETIVFCRERFSQNNVSLRLRLDHQDQLVECRSTQISQVLLNLLGNAFDAVESSVEPWVDLKTEVADGRVRLIVTDSGSGISPDLQNKIMQPFFTTKEVGKGTGLGLSISRSILLAHGGSLILDTEALNTTFILEFPVQQPVTDETNSSKLADLSASSTPSTQEGKPA